MRATVLNRPAGWTGPESAYRAPLAGIFSGGRYANVPDRVGANVVVPAHYISGNAAVSPMAGIVPNLPPLGQRQMKADAPRSRLALMHLEFCRDFDSDLD